MDVPIAPVHLAPGETFKATISVEIPTFPKMLPGELTDAVRQEFMRQALIASDAVVVEQPRLRLVPPRKRWWQRG